MKITKRARWAGTIALAVAALLGAAAPAAQAGSALPSAVTGYHYYEGYSYNPSFGSTAFTQFHATNSATQVWLNGSVSCPANNGAHVTWCGWLDNGTNHAQAGVNYTAGGQSFWFRFDVYAPIWYGELTCKREGNAGVRVIDTCPGTIG